MSNICSKANRKLSALTRVAMFHRRQTNDKINKLHERALRIVYNDTIMSFEELLVKDKTFTIHHQNIQSLAIEMCKNCE